MRNYGFEGPLKTNELIFLGHLKSEGPIKNTRQLWWYFDNKKKILIYLWMFFEKCLIIALEDLRENSRI